MRYVWYGFLTIGFSTGSIRTQIIVPGGYALCLFCRNPILCTFNMNELKENETDIEPRRLRELLCSRSCYMEYTLRVGNSGLVRKRLFDLEKGVCQGCNLDCHKLFNLVQSLDIGDRADVLFDAGFRTSLIGQKRFQRLITQQRITEGLFWEADHIVEVARDGGECSLDNYQTLCIPCHYRKTVGFLKWRATVLHKSKQN